MSDSNNFSKINFGIYFENIKDHKGVFSIAIIFSFLPYLLEMLSLLALIPLVTHLPGQDIDFNSIFPQSSNWINGNLIIQYLDYALLIAFIFFIQLISSIIKVYSSSTLVQNIILKQRERLYSRILHSGYQKVIGLDKGKTAQIFQVELLSFSNAVLSIVNLGSISLFLIIISFFLSNISLSLSLFLIPITTVVTIVIIVMNKYTYSTAQKSYESNRIESSFLIETWSNIQTILTHHALNLQKNRYFKILGNIKKRFINHQTVYMSSPNIVKLIIFLSLLILILINAYLPKDQSLSTTELISYIIILSRVQPIFSNISADISHLTTGTVAWNTLSKIHQFSHFDTGGQRNLKLKFDEKIEFKNISYAYPDKENNCLDNVSFSIYKNDLTVITGPSGIGKSTLIHILVQLIIPQNGTVEIDGIKLNSIDPESLLNNMAIVGQEVEFFQMNIRDNLLYNNPHNPSDTQILELAEKCQILDFLDSNNTSLNSPLFSSGLNLSGGQKRRLSILRALLRQPKILILDEPTAGLDANTEDNFLSFLEALKEDVTMIIVTHNPKFNNIADKIIKI